MDLPITITNTSLIILVLDRPLCREREYFFHFEGQIIFNMMKRRLIYVNLDMRIIE
jgi:hypothetical protein